MSIRIRLHELCQEPVGDLNIWLCELNLLTESDVLVVLLKLTLHVVQNVGNPLNINGVVAEDALGAPVIHNEVSQYIDERSHGCI